MRLRRKLLLLGLPLLAVLALADPASAAPVKADHVGCKVPASLAEKLSVRQQRAIERPFDDFEMYLDALDAADLLVPGAVELKPEAAGLSGVDRALFCQEIQFDINVATAEMFARWLALEACNATQTVGIPVDCADELRDFNEAMTDLNSLITTYLATCTLDKYF